MIHAVMLRRAAALGLSVIGFMAAAGCGRVRDDAGVSDLRIFHAAGFTPVLDAVRTAAARDLDLRLQTESSGSQAACRKVEELGRHCDLLILADHRLVAELLEASCSWRLDFATDEIVLGVGQRAPYTDAAEQDWVPVLLHEDVRFGRVDENQGPMGYHTLLTLQLEEIRRPVPGLTAAMIRRSARVVDDVNRLAPLLRHGDLDYAFLYRSLCRAMDIRHIPLAPAINLGRTDIDYAAAKVIFEKLGAGPVRTMTVSGAPVTWTLTVPDRGADLEAALSFISYLLHHSRDILDAYGFMVMDVPVFHGPRDRFAPFAAIAVYGGELR